MKKTTLILLFISLLGLSVYAQTPAKKGNYSFLKGESSLNIEFEYDGMMVGKKMTEEEYVKGKVEDYNKDEAGKGEKWKASWFGSRAERFEPKFIELINKSMEKTGITAGKDLDSKYTLVVKTVYTEPGFNVGVARKSAYVDFHMTFQETASKKVIDTYTLLRIPGAQVMGFDFDSGSRIAESYAKSGKMMGLFIAKGAN